MLKKLQNSIYVKQDSLTKTFVNYLQLFNPLVPASMHRTNIFNTSHAGGLGALQFVNAFIITIIIIIVRYELGIDRSVLTSSNSLFKGLPSRLRSFRLYFSIIFGILLFSLLVTCRRQFDLYLLRFSTGSTFNSSKISSFLLWSRRVYPSVLLKVSP